MRAYARFLIITLSVLLLLPAFASAEIPKTISYQGYLTDSTGAPITGAVDLQFSLYDAATGGATLWSETQANVQVNKGVYSVTLGSVAQLNLPFDAQYWLGVRVGNDNEMSPRQALTVVPYAFRAIVSDAVAAGGITSSQIAAGSITPDKLADTCAVGEVLVKTANGWACGATVSSVCSQGDFISCYRGPAGTLNVGPCRAGTKLCLENGSGYGACQSEVLPVVETCDNIDNDCDGITDNAPGAESWYVDIDGDGFGDPATGQVSCTQIPGRVNNNRDCNDNLSSVFQTTGMGSQIWIVGGSEICGDSVDNDCNGQTDEGSCSPAACNADEIAAFNSCLQQCLGNIFCMGSCLQGVGGSVECNMAITNAAMCLTSNSCIQGSYVVYECANQGCRQQWETAFGAFPPACTDGQTHACGTDTGECSQGIQTCLNGQWGACEGSIGPIAEICGDGLDNDCNGTIDDVREWYYDADGDGFGDPAGELRQCSPEPGFVDNLNDCDDTHVAINPNAPEICDGIDNNCDGLIDMNVPGGQVWWYDEDGDGFGRPDISTTGCAQPPAGYVASNTDCDDRYSWVYPGAPEQCDNNIDDNCDGTVDEGCLDSDADGYPDAVDCAPFVASVHPGAVEVCDGTDNNCDGTVDEGCLDSDADGYPDTVDCAPFAASVHPGAAEVCDGTDNNCDGIVDEGCLDSDADGYPDAVDCGPFAASVHPGAAEVCDGIDNNCDGTVDEGCLPADGTPCGDGNLCTSGETYLLGVCQGGSPVNCDDTSECTTDLYDPASGCQHALASLGTACTGGICDGAGTCIPGPADGTPCNDGNFCTSGETYLLGVCQGGVPVNCDDANECTADSCNPVSGCQHPLVPAGTACTGGTCDAGGTCIAMPVNGTPCNDSNACTTGETYLSGVCQGGTPLSCDDANECTVDLCDVVMGCTHTFAAPGTICGSSICDASGNCIVPTCSDQVKNGTETDVDCGGGCVGCADGKACNNAADCLGGSCWNNICQVLPGSSPLNPGDSCLDLKMSLPATGDGVYWIDPDGSGPVPPFQAYCDMTTDGGGWTLWASMTQSGTSSSSLIQLSSNNYMDTGRFGVLRIVSSQFMARGQSTGTRFYLSMGEAVSGNCHNLSSSTPEVVGGSFLVYGHKETSGCNVLGGDAAYLSITSSSPNMHVVSSAAVGHWHPDSSSGAVLNLNSNTVETKVELYMR